MSEVSRLAATLGLSLTFICLSPSSSAAVTQAASVALPTRVLPGQTFTLNLTGLPGNPKDWVTVVPAGTPDSSYGQYFYTEGARGGSYTFGPLPAGQYEARVYFDWPAGGYAVRVRRSFVVGGAAQGSTSVAPVTTPAAPPPPTGNAAQVAFKAVPAGRYNCTAFLGNALITLGHLDIRPNGTYQGVRLGGGGPVNPFTFLPASRLVQFRGGLGRNFGDAVTARLERDRTGQPYISVTYAPPSGGQHSMTCETE